MANDIEPLRIFISSTFRDLKEHRAKVIQVVDGLKYYFEAMESFGADSRNPLDACLAKVADCQLFIGIVGMTYDSIDPESGKSYSELEYDQARKLGLPCLIYLIDEDNALVTPNAVEKGKGARKLKTFKKRLRTNHVVKTFISPETLGEDLQRSLPAEIARMRESRAELPPKHSLAPESKVGTNPYVDFALVCLVRAVERYVMSLYGDVIRAFSIHMHEASNPMISRCPGYVKIYGREGIYGSYAVYVQGLRPIEIRAVIAHELGHIALQFNPNLEFHYGLESMPRKDECVAWYFAKKILCALEFNNGSSLGVDSKEIQDTINSMFGENVEFQPAGTINKQSIDRAINDILYIMLHMQ